MKPLYNRQALPSHIVHHGLRSVFWSMCPGGQAWRFGVPQISAIVYVEMFLLGGRP